jgi:hypothetical protein
VKGLGAAMKLLFLPSQVKQNIIFLEKTEVIALVNLMHKLSESIHYYESY